jgi:outer membrane protein TolC
MKTQFSIFTGGTTILTIFLLMLTGIQVDAQEKRSFSLAEAQRYALENNTSVRNAALDVKIAQKKIWETTAIGLPQVTAKGQYQNIFTVPMVSFGPSFDPTKLPDGVNLTRADILSAYSDGEPIPLGVKENSTLDITVSQLIFSGSYIVGLQASRVYAQLSNQTLEKTKNDVLESVTTTYCMILVGEESRRILNENLQIVEKTLYEINEMYGQGFVEKTDADQLKVTANTLRNTLNSVERNIQVAYNLMQVQLGTPDSVKIALSDSLPAVIAALNIDPLVAEQFLLDNSPEYQLLGTAEDLARLDYKREKWEFLPTVAAAYVRTEKANAPAFDFSPKDVLAIQATLPIFTSGQRLAKLSQKKMALEQARNNRDYIGENLRLQASQSRFDLLSKNESFKNQKMSMELSREIYDRTLEKYRQGVASSMDLMNSQNQYLLSLSNYYQSVFDVVQAQAKLEKLLNKGIK